MTKHIAESFKIKSLLIEFFFCVSAFHILEVKAYIV